MTTHSSATKRGQASDVTQTPHGIQTSPTNQTIRASETRVRSTEQTDALKPPGEPPAPKIEALVEVICSAGAETAGALFVLMGMMEHSAQPEVLAHTAKHLAFTRRGEFNLFGMVDAQITAVQRGLLAHGTPVS